MQVTFTDTNKLMKVPFSNWKKNLKISCTIICVFNVLFATSSAIYAEIKILILLIKRCFNFWKEDLKNQSKYHNDFFSISWFHKDNYFHWQQSTKNNFLKQVFHKDSLQSMSTNLPITSDWAHLLKKYSLKNFKTLKIFLREICCLYDPVCYRLFF